MAPRLVVLAAIFRAVAQPSVTPAAHPRVPGFHHFRPEVLLPDYDCQYLPESWFETTENFLNSLQLFSQGSARASGWKTLEDELEIFRNYAELFGKPPGLVKDCHFADLVNRLKLFSCCTVIEKLGKAGASPELHAEAAGHCQLLRDEPIHLSRELFGAEERYWGLRSWEQLLVFLNSRFARYFHAWAQRTRQAFKFMRIEASEDLDCQSHSEPPSGWNWPSYLDILQRMSEEPNEGEVAMDAAMTFAMNTRATTDMQQKLLECPLGMLSILAHQMSVAFGGITEQVTLCTYFMSIAADVIEKQLKSPEWFLQSLLQSRWPILEKLAKSSYMIQARTSFLTSPRYQNKPYKLDFHPSELLHPFDERHQLPHGTTAAALELRRNAWGRSDSYAQLMRALQQSLETAEPLGPRPVVMFTMVYGQRYAGYLPGWIQRAASFKHGARTLIFCLDETTTQVCQEHHPFPALCVHGDVQSTANKFHFSSVVINSGFDVLYLDFDLVFFRDPLPPILKASERADLLLTRDFGTECINIGVVFMKSHPDNAHFLQDLIIWLWHHPYEFCQKAFAGLMGLEDVQWNEVFGEIVGRVPRWGFLDSLNAFVTSTIYGQGATGWTGSEDLIVIYHFLDGTGGVDASIAVRGYVNLFDLFYANDHLNLSDTETPLYVQDAQVLAQLEFSKLDGPKRLEACAHLEEAAYPPWKLRQRHGLWNRRDLRPVEI